MLDLLEDLTREVSAVAPIKGIKTNPLAIEFDNATQAEKDAANAILASFDAERESAISEIKGRASRDILLMAPTWRQRNAIARTLDLVEKIARGYALTDAEESELAAYRNLWDQIKQRREQSDDEENAL